MILLKKKRFPVDTNFYCDGNDLIVDKIIKYEKLYTDLPILLKNFGILFLPQINEG